MSTSRLDVRVPTSQQPYFPMDCSSGDKHAVGGGDLEQGIDQAKKCMPSFTPIKASIEVDLHLSRCDDVECYLMVNLHFLLRLSLLGENLM